MTVSNLVDGERIGWCTYGERYHEITRLTPHHAAMVGATAWDIAKVFDYPRKASCNYAIGNDGSLVCVEPEEIAACTSSNQDNDERAITFEIANLDYDWNISKAAQETFINLCVDIIRRNPGLGGSFNWTGDMSGNVTVHRWFFATACPGDPLFNMLPELGAEINRRLNGGGRYGVPMECILNPDESGMLFHVSGNDIVYIPHPDCVTALQDVAKECGKELPYVEIGTKEAPWGFRFFQACGKEALYRRMVWGEE